MYIVEIAPECAPVAKVGGLADVVNGLSFELAIRGNDVEIILPKYDCMRYDHIWGLTQTFSDLWVPWYNGAIHCTVYFGFVHGRKCYFIEPHSKDQFFNRNTFYGCNDDAFRFAFFSKAALEFLLKSNKRPDVIHCHDWQTGLVPVMLFEIYNQHGMGNQRVCYTIHNFKHQGVHGNEILTATGLNRPDYYFHADRLQDPSNKQAINFMKGSIVYSNFVTTVSPHHAWETRYTDQGHGLGSVLYTHANKYGGILNGLDYNTWNPELDKIIPSQYSTETIQKKYDNKAALRDRLWLYKDNKPIIAYVGRLDDQKGLDLIYHTAFWAVRNGAQFVLLGACSNNAIFAKFQNLKNTLNDNPHCHIELGFNEELSHLIYAGADMLIVPSMFEPCGLAQMIALKYGTVPIVRAVGGLASTVFDRDYSNVNPSDRNGYTFNNYDHAGIESALQRAVGLYYSYPDHFKDLMLNGMRCDYSWNAPGQHYINIFNLIRHK